MSVAPAFPGHLWEWFIWLTMKYLHTDGALHLPCVIIKYAIRAAESAYIQIWHRPQGVWTLKYEAMTTLWNPQLPCYSNTYSGRLGEHPRCFIQLSQTKSGKVKDEWSPFTLSNHWPNNQEVETWGGWKTEVMSLESQRRRAPVSCAHRQLSRQPQHSVRPPGEKDPSLRNLGTAWREQSVVGDRQEVLSVYCIS